MKKADFLTPKNKTLCLQQVVIPDYRVDLVTILRDQWAGVLEVYAGDCDFGGSPVSADRAWDQCTRIKNRYFGAGRFLWQSGCLSSMLRADVTILNANMRILSNTLVLILRRLLGRQTLLWGHAQGQSVCARYLRRAYLRMSNGFIAYTESQAGVLRNQNSRLPVWVASNSCVSASDCRPVKAEDVEVDSVLYVGRLVKAKKVGLLLEGYCYAKKVGLLNTSIRLVLVGDGDERSALEARVEEYGLRDVVEFLGHISDVETLRDQYRTAACSVSPGYVGLSATQSFSFGVPMLVAQGEFHSPEIEACQEGMNAQFFEKDNPVSLAEGLAGFVNERRRWLGRRKEISEWTRANYSFEAMGDAFVKAVEDVSTK